MKHSQAYAIKSKLLAQTAHVEVHMTQENLTWVMFTYLQQLVGGIVTGNEALNGEWL